MIKSVVHSSVILNAIRRSRIYPKYFAINNQVTASVVCEDVVYRILGVELIPDSIEMVETDDIVMIVQMPSGVDSAHISGV